MGFAYMHTTFGGVLRATAIPGLRTLSLVLADGHEFDWLVESPAHAEAMAAAINAVLAMPAEQQAG